MLRFIIAAFLVANALIHASFLTPAPPPRPSAPQWPFRLDQSWALSPLGLTRRAIRAVGTVLVCLVLLAFATAAFGLVVQQGWWRPVTVAGACLSALLLFLYLHPWLLLGPLVDAGIVAALLLARWPSLEAGGA